MGEKKCPSCGNKMGGSVLYRCDNCGDVRCPNTKCTGSMGGRKAHSGGSGAICQSCLKGHYKMIHV